MKWIDARMMRVLSRHRMNKKYVLAASTV